TDYFFQRNQTFPMPDAVQEFSIQTSNYSAATGNNAGAVVSVVTRSGTNEFHGGAFEFVRNRVFNARNFFASQQDFLKRNQFGVHAGGPVVLPGYNGRKKSFFFVGWQGTRLRDLRSALNTFAPTIDQRRGDFSTCGAPCNRPIRDPLTGQPFPGNQIPVSRFDPAAVKVASFIPAVAGTGFTQISKPVNHRYDQGITRIDHQLTAKDRLTGRYFIDDFQNAGSFDPSNLLSYRQVLAAQIRIQNSMVGWTRTISQSALNDFHFAYNRYHAARGPYFQGVPSMQELGVRLPIYPTLPSISQIEVQGFFNIGDNLEAAFIRNSFEGSNRTSWVRGRHSIQFGGELSRYRADVDNEFRRAGHFVFNGNVTGLSMADFFLGRLGNFDQGTGEYRDARVTYMALFFQDDFKATPRVTLNLGMRWEPTPPWHDVKGRIQRFRIEDFQNGVRSSQFRNAPPGILFRGDPGVPRDGAEPDNNNVGGRFGFAWDMFGNGKTSLRGGAGMFYDQRVFADFNDGFLGAPPWSIRVNVVQPQGPFSDPYQGRSDFNLISVQSIGSPDAPFPLPAVGATQDGRQETPLQYNWNLTLEREIFPEWLARAAYVGSASNYGRSAKQLNAARYIPGASTTGNTDSRRLFAPQFGNLTYLTEDRRSYYNSLQTSLVKRFSRGLTVLANYTWSKALGNYDLEVAPWYLPGADNMTYGPMDIDHRHRFVLSYVWELPNTSTTNPFLRHVLHGWQATGFGQYQSGGPFTVTSGQDNSLTGIGRDRAKVTGVSSNPPSGADKRAWFNPAAFAVNDIGTFGGVGTGAFYGPHIFSWDMGFFKRFRVTERVNMQFRTEMFNIFNQVNFANPNTNVSGGGFGTITNTQSYAGDPRIIQFGLKVDF
ncbi:MAG: carboxypeptidase regulatory-like domain-containing protein, partial [Acidobacteria bacterium]|nr:carboxypeptidase regulatory-like domain-containing protein [Acidobacteriota bacterium]